MQEEIYWMVTAHPLVRFPIFLMGMLAGLQVLRAHGKWEDFEDPNVNKSLLYTLQPWGTAKTRCHEKEEEKNIRTTKICKEDSIKIWRKRVDFNSFMYIGFLTALIVTQVALDVKYDDPNLGKFNILSLPSQYGVYLTVSVKIHLSTVLRFTRIRSYCMDLFSVRKK